MTWPADFAVPNIISAVVHVILLLTTHSTSSRTNSRWRCRLTSPALFNQELCDNIRCSPVKSRNVCLCRCFNRKTTFMGVRWSCLVAIQSTCNTDGDTPLFTTQRGNRLNLYSLFVPEIRKSRKQIIDRNIDKYVNSPERQIIDTENSPSKAHHTGRPLGNTFLETSPSHQNTQGVFSKTEHRTSSHILVKRTEGSTVTNNAGLDRSKNKTNSYKSLEFNKTANVDALAVIPNSKPASGKARSRGNKKGKTIKDTSPVPAWAIAIIVLCIVILLVLAVLIIY